jgi:very-short-patch-repair endonuclease
MDLQRAVWERGGIVATYELLRIGATSRMLTLAVRTGILVRVRQGWYGLPDADAILEAAVRVGGRATCITAGASYGMWTVEARVLHVRVPKHDSRLRSPQDRRRRLESGEAVRVHWRNGGVGTRHRVAPEIALVDMIGCQSLERVIAAADSALRAGLVTRRRWLDLTSGYPERLARLLGEADGIAESWIESIGGFRLRRAGFILRRQVLIANVGRVDLMIGDRLIIEFDGWEFHRSREAFERDRRRDAELARRGYIVLRFTHRQVTREWHWVLATIRACLAVS